MAAENPDSTWGVYRCKKPQSYLGRSYHHNHQSRSGLLQKTPLTEKQFLVVKTELEPEAAAKEYQVEEDYYKSDAIMLDNNHYHGQR